MFYLWNDYFSQFNHSLHMFQLCGFPSLAFIVIIIFITIILASAMVVDLMVSLSPGNDITRRLPLTLFSRLHWVTSPLHWATLGYPALVPTNILSREGGALGNMCCATYCSDDCSMKGALKKLHTLSAAGINSPWSTQPSDHI